MDGTAGTAASRGRAARRPSCERSDAMTLQRLELGRTGVRLSQLALGCMNLGTATPREEAFAILDAYLEAGGDFLDTANCYSWWMAPQGTGDESERLLGEWLRSRRCRDRVFLATKVGGRLRDLARVRDPDGTVHWERVQGEFERLAPAVIERAVEESLHRLGVEAIDLYYAHVEDRETPLEARLEAFHRLVKAGKVRHLGLSNHRAWRVSEAQTLARLRGLTPAVAVQQQWTYLRPRHGYDLGASLQADDELLDCLDANRDLSLVAYSPILKGVYRDHAARARYYGWKEFDTDDSRTRWDRIQAVAARLGVDGNRLVLAWMLQQPLPVFPLIGPRTLPQLRESLAAAELRLDDATRAELAAR
jgi:aryl-alcohol dehydrogenase-like predicted oxidoreductase